MVGLVITQMKAYEQMKAFLLRTLDDVVSIFVGGARILYDALSIIAMLILVIGVYAPGWYLDVKLLRGDKAVIELSSTPKAKPADDVEQAKP